MKESTMYYSFKKALHCTAMILSLFNQHSEANTIKLAITPKQDLHAGRIHDGAELATIYVSGMKDTCVLNVWIDPPSQETLPGHYILTDSKKGGKKLNARLSGEHWQPDLSFGRGVRMIMSEKIISLKLLASGEQTLEPDILPVKLTAMCITAPLKSEH